jgi:hypothetical protein
MRFYKATATIRLSAGIVLALTAEQVQPRQHLLDVGSDGKFTTREPIELKAGERVGFEQEPRALLPMLEPLEFDDDGDGELFGGGHHAGGESDITEPGSADTVESASGVDDIKQPDAVGDTAGDPSITETVGADLSAQAGTEDKGNAESADAISCTDGIDQLKMVTAAHLGIDPEVVSDKPAKKSAK